MSVKEVFGIAGEPITAGSLRMPPVPVKENAEVLEETLNPVVAQRQVGLDGN